MITKEEVQKFLNQFHEKTRVFGIIYRDDRGKNQKALEELEIVPSYRRVVIENLIVEDYVQGPVVDELNKLGEMWVFGKKKEEWKSTQENVRRCWMPNNLHFIPFGRTSIDIPV